jgi:hypothetical protein
MLRPYTSRNDSNAWLHDESRQDAENWRVNPALQQSRGDLAGGRQLTVAGEICAAGFVAIRLAKDFAEAFAGFVDLGF